MFGTQQTYSFKTINMFFFYYITLMFLKYTREKNYSEFKERWKDKQMIRWEQSFL